MIFTYDLIAVCLLVLRAIAPHLPPEDLLSHDEIARGILEQLQPVPERVQSGPSVRGTTPAGGSPARHRDFTRPSEDTHGAFPLHTGQVGNVQSAIDGQQSQRRVLDARSSETGTPNERWCPLVPFFRRISERVQRLFWRNGRRRIEIQMQVHQQFNAFLQTLTTPTREMIGPLVYLGTSGNTMEFRFNIFSNRLSPRPSYWVTFPIHIGLMGHHPDAYILRGRFDRFMQRFLRDLHRYNKHNLQAGDTIPNTKKLGYMTMPTDYQQGTSGANRRVKVPLDQAIGMLESTSNNELESVHKDLDIITNEQGVNTNRKNTEDETHKDLITSSKSIHDDTGDGTRLTSSLQDISEVLLGDPLHGSCVICQCEFCQPEKNSENVWMFEKICNIDGCDHFFHPHCLEEWIIKNQQNSCPECRAQVFPLTLVPEP
ncbi:hypothetical protein Pst134EB_020077 [Puccinia striiformis f. sp. tritici]|nr:hypothetical protein Pst134EB_020077 [Puccinia striiformis f. sp. tritici]